MKIEFKHGEKLEAKVKLGNIAVGCLVVHGEKNYLIFDNCFEGGSGDEVVMFNLQTNDTENFPIHDEMKTSDIYTPNRLTVVVDN